jgi:hypothetical protein
VTKRAVAATDASGYTTTDAAGYATTATTINVVAGSVFEVSDFVKIGTEVMKITAISGNALTVSRGVLVTATVADSDAKLIAAAATAVTKQSVAITIHGTAGATTIPTATGASATTVVVATATSYASGDYIKIGNEVMKITAIDDKSFTVIRGAAGTTAAAITGTSTACNRYTVVAADFVGAFSTNTVEPYSLGAGATFLNVVDSSIFRINDVVKVDNEAMVIKAISGNALTVTRAAAGTTAVDITAVKSVIRQVVTSPDATRRRLTAAATTVTAGTYTASTVIIIVAAHSGFAANDFVKVGTEIMKITAINTVSNALTVTRGVVGTTVPASITGTPALTKVTLAVTPLTAGRVAAAAPTTNTAAVNYAANAVAITVEAGTTFTVNDFVKVGNEVMKITGIAANVLTVTRGAAGTTAATITGAQPMTRQTLTVADPYGTTAAATTTDATGYAATASVVAITVAAGKGSTFVVNDFVKVGNEVMKITAISTDTLTVIRAAAGTALGVIGTSTTAITRQTLTLAAANLIPLSGFVVGDATTPPSTATFKPAVLDAVCAVATVSPTASPTMAPTVAPTTGPTRHPTLATGTAPTDAPTPAPTPTPTSAPSKAPTSSPTLWPTDIPTNLPTPIPSATPTAIPSAAPTAVGATLSPTTSPTAAPTLTPTTPNPTNAPTNTPTIAPTITPAPTAVGVTTSPTTSPTMAPTTAPTKECNGDGHMVVTYTVAVTATQKPGVDTFHSGTLDLTDATKLGLFQSGLRNAFAEVQCFYATEYPTTMPSALPTTMPTFAPNTKFPTPAPSSVPPSLAPTATPTVSPTNTPTATPTVSPTNMPTMTPTDSPTATPTATPTKFPTKKPTVAATGVTNLPTATPTATPTSFPTSYPSKYTGATASPTHLPTKIPTAQYSGSPLLFPGCDAKIKFSAFDCGSGACSYTGVAAVGATPAPTPQTFQVVGSMVLSAFTKVSFSADHQSAFKTTLKSTVKLPALPDDSIILSITEVPSTRRLTSRRLAGGISVSYTITGVSASAADSAIATLSDPNAGISFTATLKTELQAKGVAAPDGGWDAVTATPGAVTKEDTTDAVATATPAPTTVPQTVPPTAATTVALSRACSLRANTIAILSTVLLAIWATSVGTEHC